MKIVCKKQKPFSHITINKIYETTENVVDYFFNLSALKLNGTRTGKLIDFYEIINDDGISSGYPKNYFYTIIELRSQKIKRILK